jgi:Flp pilus assembly protein TadG
MRHLHNPGPTAQQGLAAVEATIVLPILLLLMLATAEFGRAFYQYNSLTKAVRDGARYLSENATDGITGVIADPLDTAAVTRTKNLVVYGNPAGTGDALLEGLGIEQVTITPVDVAHVEVRANYTYRPIFASGLPDFGFGSGSIGTNFTFQATSTMRAL